MKIEPGDLMTASVSVKSGLENETRNLLAVKVASFATPDLSSAEWIAEAPTACWGASCKPVLLADFGSGGTQTLFATTNGNVTDTSTAGTCRPSVPGAKGASFTVGWGSTARPGC